MRQCPGFDVWQLNPFGVGWGLRRYRRGETTCYVLPQTSTGNTPQDTANKSRRFNQNVSCFLQPSFFCLSFDSFPPSSYPPGIPPSNIYDVNVYVKCHKLIFVCFKRCSGPGVWRKASSRADVRLQYHSRPSPVNTVALLEI